MQGSTTNHKRSTKNKDMYGQYITEINKEGHRVGIEPTVHSHATCTCASESSIRPAQPPPPFLLCSIPSSYLTLQYNTCYTYKHLHLPSPCTPSILVARGYDYHCSVMSWCPISSVSSVHVTLVTFCIQRTCVAPHVTVTPLTHYLTWWWLFGIDTDVPHNHCNGLRACSAVSKSNAKLCMCRPRTGPRSPPWLLHSRHGETGPPTMIIAKIKQSY